MARGWCTVSARAVDSGAALSCGHVPERVHRVDNQSRAAQLSDSMPVGLLLRFWCGAAAAAAAAGGLGGATEESRAAAVESSTAAAAAAAVNLLDGSWEGTEVGVFDPAGEYYGTAKARLSLKSGAGTYTIHGVASEVEPNELASDGSFAAGHIKTGASMHGAFEAQANATHLWGSWATYGSKRIFLWQMQRSAPPPPPPKSCGNFTTQVACTGHASPDTPRCVWDGHKCASRVTQIDIVEGNTTAPWGTLYSCFRVPSAVQTPDGTLLVFLESRIGSCADQAPKDITFKYSQDKGTSWSELMLAIGPTKHKPCAFAPNGCLDFSSRNPYATVTASGDIVLGYSDSTACPTADHGDDGSSSTRSSGPRSRSGDGVGCAVSYQTLLQNRSGWKRVNPVTRVDLGEFAGVLAGPGEGIVLGRHSRSSPREGRWIGCGATYLDGSDKVRGSGLLMTVWYSDNDGGNYSFAGGALPFKGIGECQAVELINGSVMINARNEVTGCRNFPGCQQHRRLYAVSNDGGDTFGAPQFAEDLPEPICSAGLISHGAVGTLYFSNPDSASARSHMTLKKSTDSGNHWQVDTPIYPGPSAYSVVVPLDAKRVGVVYERTYPEERILRITLAAVVL
jgi:sialidase-1